MGLGYDERQGEKTGQDGARHPWCRSNAFPGNSRTDVP